MDFRILNSKQSKQIANKINCFENQFFDDELQCPVNFFDHWIESDCFINNSAVSSDGELLGSCSLLITDKTSFDNFSNGYIKEYDLMPASIYSHKEVYLYYCTLISLNKTISKKLIINTFREVLEFKIKNRLIFKDAFTMPCTAAGINYLKNNPFVCNGNFYQNKYPIFVFDPYSVQNYFWKDLIEKEKRPLTINIGHLADRARMECVRI